jgi:hypothetical protein
MKIRGRQLAQGFPMQSEFLRGAGGGMACVGSPQGLFLINDFAHDISFERFC